MQSYKTILLVAILSISTAAQAQFVDIPYGIIEHDDINYYDPNQGSALLSDETEYGFDVDQSGNKISKLDSYEQPPIDPDTGEVAQRIADEVYCRGDVIVSLGSNSTSIYSFVGTGASVYDAISNAGVLAKPNGLFTTTGLSIGQFVETICSIPALNLTPTFSTQVHYCESTSRFSFQSGKIVIGRRINVNVGTTGNAQYSCR